MFNHNLARSVSSLIQGVIVFDKNKACIVNDFMCICLKISVLNILSF